MRRAGQKMEGIAGGEQQPASEGPMAQETGAGRAGEAALGGCGDASTVHGMAGELFQLASLLIGEQTRALRLIESSLATMEIDPCADPEAAREQARACVVRAALSQLALDEPAAFMARSMPLAHDPCIQDDDLAAAGVTQSQLHSWLEQDGRQEVRRGLRSWLEELPLAQRTIFVQRAVLGQGNEATAHLLREAGGTEAAGWTPEHVGESFRRALCSLANSLAHAPAADPLPA